LAKIVDILSVVMLAGAAGAFVFGVRALGDSHDLQALYWLLVGGLLLRAGVDMLRPPSGVR
jgi:hypothetical protein